MIDLSIVLVHHETLEKTHKTILSIYKTVNDFKYEIIVIDNSINTFFPSEKADIYVKIENNGFANACNIGSNKANGEYILFLNSDVELCECALDSAMHYIRRNDEIGILGIKTLLPDGTLDAACKRGFPTPFASFCYIVNLDRLFPKSKSIGRYHMTYLDPNKTNEVECVSGAFMLMKRDFFEKLGGWDERFFMYSEDIDMCKRAYDCGKKIVYFADGCMMHYKGGSSTPGNNKKLLEHFYDGMVLFYDKHYSNEYPIIVKWLVIIFIKLKKTAAIARM